MDNQEAEMACQVQKLGEFLVSEKEKLEASPARFREEPTKSTLLGAG